MANVAPSELAVVDPGRVLSGSSLDSVNLAEFGPANNQAIARTGTGTPRVAQVFPRRGSTTPTGVFVTTSDASYTAPNCRWLIPDTGGAVKVRCYILAKSVAGTAEVQFGSVNASDLTASVVIPTAQTLIDVGELTIDAAGGDEEVRLIVYAAGDVATVDAAYVRVEPIASPLPTGLSKGCKPFDEDEWATPQPVASAQGTRICDNAETLRDIPHVYLSWSGVSGIAGTDPEVMVPAAHCVPCLVWQGAARHGWSLTVAAYVDNTGLPEGVVRVGAEPQSHVGQPTHMASIDVAANAGPQWYRATLTPPASPVALSLPAGWYSVVLTVWAQPSAAADIRRIADHDGTRVLSTVPVQSLSVWGR